MTTVTKVRFAPSPTGYLHVGNVRTALVNWLFARATGGRFLLRIDDTDAERSKPEYEAAIEEDLQWLGLNWDERARQSERFERYAQAVEKLKAAGRLYACYETPEELDVQRKMLASRGLPPVYNRAGMKLTAAQRAEYEAQGRKPHWRFLLNDEEAAWDDLVRGSVRMKASSMSDPVLLREDGVPVYTLASVVDDGELGVTHVIRGEDHVSNTAVQTQLFAALGFALPRFAHLALLKTKEGELSKRLGGNDIRALREGGILPMAVNSLLARLGTSQPVEPFAALQPLIDSFDFAHFGRAPANYDPAEMEKLNEKLTHHLPFTAVSAQLPGIDEAFWNSVRGNIKTVAEARQWWSILHNPDSPNSNPQDQEYLTQAAALLPPEPWDASTYDTWISAVKTATARKGRELFMPLRLSLTGMEHGPELKALLPLLGRENTLKRLGLTAAS